MAELFAPDSAAEEGLLSGQQKPWLKDAVQKVVTKVKRRSQPEPCQDPLSRAKKT